MVKKISFILIFLIWFKIKADNPLCLHKIPFSKVEEILTNYYSGDFISSIEVGIFEKKICAFRDSNLRVKKEVDSSFCNIFGYFGYNGFVAIDTNLFSQYSFLDISSFYVNKSFVTVNLSHYFNGVTAFYLKRTDFNKFINNNALIKCYFECTSDKFISKSSFVKNYLNVNSNIVKKIALDSNNYKLGVADFINSLVNDSNVYNKGVNLVGYNFNYTKFSKDPTKFITLEFKSFNFAFMTDCCLNVEYGCNSFNYNISDIKKYFTKEEKQLIYYLFFFTH